MKPIKVQEVMRKYPWLYEGLQVMSGVHKDENERRESYAVLRWCSRNIGNIDEAELNSVVLGHGNMIFSNTLGDVDYEGGQSNAFCLAFVIGHLYSDVTIAYKIICTVPNESNPRWVEVQAAMNEGYDKVVDGEVTLRRSPGNLLRGRLSSLLRSGHKIHAVVRIVRMEIRYKCCCVDVTIYPATAKALSGL